MAARPTALASGERAVALVNSSDNVIWTGDLVLGADAPSDDVLLLARALEQATPRCVRRAAPRNRPPAADADRIDRDTVIRNVGSAIGDGAAVNLVGPDGIGKSYVLRAAAGALARDAVIWIDGEGRDADDVLQAVFHELYDADRIVADRERRRAAFEELQLPVVVDGGDSAGPTAARLREELSKCAVTIASRTDAAWGSGAKSIGVSGLDHEDALELMARRTGPLDEQGRQAANRLIELLSGNPRRLLQAAGLSVRASLPLPALVAALADDPEGELRRLLLEALEPTDRALVEALAGACGATLATERLRALTGTADADERLAALERDGYVASGSPRYRLTGALASLRIDARAEETAEHLAAFARNGTHEATARELPAALALLAWADENGRDEVAITLGRAIAPAAVYRQRWGAWGELLERVRAAGQRAGDRSSEAWALHHIGTRAYATGEVEPALSALRKALALREQLQDDVGAAATRHNLEFILEPPPPPPNGNGESPPPRGGGDAPQPGPRRWTRLVGAAVIGALAIAGVAALAGGGSNGDQRITGETIGDSQSTDPGENNSGPEARQTDTRRPTIAIRTPSENARYPAGKRVFASFGCRDNVRVAHCDGSVDGTALKSGAALPGAVGTHVLVVRAEDAAGLKRAERVRYTVTSVPEDLALHVTITSPEPGASFAPKEVPRAAFNCALGDTPLDCTGTVTLTEEPAITIRSGDQLPGGIGAHTLVVTADDGDHKPVIARRTYSVAQPTVTLTIEFASPFGENQRVLVAPSGSECRDTCQIAVVPAEPVTLQAEYFDGEAQQWSPKGVNWDNCTPVGDGCTVTPDTDDLTVRVSLGE